MKRFYSVLLIALMFFMVLPFVSCKKNYEVDSDGLCIEFEAGRKNAIKNKQNILLLVTMEDDDLYSRTFLDHVVRTPDFEEIKDAYTLIHFDFSEASYGKTIYKPEASKAENKEAEKISNIMLYNAQVASLLDVSYTPAMYILTDEGYYIADSLISEQVSSMSSFKRLLDSFGSKVERFNTLFAATTEGTSLDKVAAIDAVFESTDMEHRVLLAELIREIPKLDKVNRTGLVSKYLLAAAECDAINMYRAGQIGEAINAYTKVTKEKHLSPEHRQQAFYMAAYLLMSSGSSDFSIILDYLKKSVEANPNGADVANIQNVLDYVLTVQAEALAAQEAAKTQAQDNLSEIIVEDPEEILETETQQ